MISPHPWGWPGLTSAELEVVRDFPTPVGMARLHEMPDLILARFPHTRGDGPFVALDVPRRLGISPHPWGWPVVTIFVSNMCQDFPTPVGMARRQLKSSAICSTQDFPTPVGMARIPGRTWRHHNRFPHTRGDGPVRKRISTATPAISPHPWGWPGGCAMSNWMMIDFPTPVGMARVYPR